MDRIDPKSSTWAVEHAREQTSRTRLSFWIHFRTEIAELARKHGAFKPDPASQHSIDAVRHLRRTGFGECEAENL